MMYYLKTHVSDNFELVKFFSFQIKKEYHEKPLGKFLNSILNFNSLIPPNKEINDENNSKKQQKVRPRVFNFIIELIIMPFK